MSTPNAPTPNTREMPVSPPTAAPPPVPPTQPAPPPAPSHAPREDEHTTSSVRPISLAARFSLLPKLTYLVVAEVIAFAIIIATRPNLWVTITVLAVTLLIAFIAFDQATLPIWLGRAVRYRWRKIRPPAAKALPEAFDVTVPGIGTVGMRWDGRILVSMVAVHGKRHTPTVLVGSGAVSDSVVPLPTVARLLEQDGGLQFETIDVVSAGRRTTGTEYARVYDAVVGERPAVGQRATWLVLRLNPDQCAAALGWRLDTKQAVAAATERVRIAIEATGCRARSLTAKEMEGATSALLGGQNAESIEESWAGVEPDGSDFINLYEIPPGSITNAVLAAIWSADSSLTTVTLRMTLSRTGVKVGAIARLHTAGPMENPPVLNLQAPRGRARDAFRMTVPLGLPAKRYDLNTIDLSLDQLATLRIIPGADGQIIGNVRTGYPTAVPLLDPVTPTLIKVNAALAVTAQIVARAAATGARVAIFTDRPAAWTPITERGSVYIADPSATHDAALIVNDLGDSAAVIRPERPGRGVLVVCRSLDERDADIAITQLDQETVRVISADREAALSVRFSRSEPRFFQHLTAPAGAAR